MLVNINSLYNDIANWLRGTGLSEQQVLAITDNIISAELAGKETHGLMRLPLIRKWIEDGKIAKMPPDPSVLKKQINSVLIKGNGNSGYLVLPFAINEAKKLMKNNAVVIGSLTDTGPSVGYFAYYANLASVARYLFVGFSNTDGGIAPFGSVASLWGHNPIAISIPFQNGSISFDLGCGTESWGEVLLKSIRGQSLTHPENYFDSNGQETIQPAAVLNGGAVAPFGGKKGSALIFFIEIIAGLFTGSRAGQSVRGGWGTTFLLIDPYIFVDKKFFDKNMEVFIDELKQSQRKTEFTEVFYPGEKSKKKYTANLNSGKVEINKEIYQLIFGVSSFNG